MQLLLCLLYRNCAERGVSDWLAMRANAGGTSRERESVRRAHLASTRSSHHSSIHPSIYSFTTVIFIVVVVVIGVVARPSSVVRRPPDALSPARECFAIDQTKQRDYQLSFCVCVCVCEKERASQSIRISRQRKENV